jgi:hypothetical protein
MHDLEQLDKQKERILSTIKFRGPSLPVQIAKALGITPLFASVFLSELRADGKLKSTDMRVGSSPLYFLTGQESQLEGFTKFLNEREREAFNLLKENLILKDEEQMPVMRVALRAIKDFAIPIKVNINNEEKIFWRYFTLVQSEFEKMVSNKIRGLGKEDAEIELKPKLVLAESGENFIGAENSLMVVELKPEVNEKEKVSAAKKEKEEGNFVKNLREHLTARNIEIMEIYVEKKKEFEAKVRIDSLFGKQELYLVAKDKKSVVDKDLAAVWQKSYSKKLGAILMSPGDLNKKAREHSREWGNLVKFEQLRF